MGVWIETYFLYQSKMSADVTPYVGVWIETEKIYNAEGNVESHPTWVCGLKQIQTEYYKNWFK